MSSVVVASMASYGAKTRRRRRIIGGGRRGAGRCGVYLCQYQKVEDATVGLLQNDFMPLKANTHAPNLRRVAVVSAPVVDKEGEPIAQKLNENVSQALEGAKAIAAKKGFKPDMADFKHLGEGQVDAFTKAHIEYTSG